MHHRKLCLALLISLPFALGAAPLKDARGHELKFAKRPERVLSSSLASDEVLIELLGYGDSLQRLVGVSSLADDVRYSNIVPVPPMIKGRFNGDVEAALALSPDLIILASFNRPEALRRFEQAKVPIFVLPDFFDFDGLLRHVEIIGDLIKEPVRAAALQGQIRAELARLNERALPMQANPPRVLHIYSDGTVSGSATMLDAIVRAAGGRNAASSLPGWKKLSLEAVLALDPDCLISGDDDQLSIAQLPAFRQLRAVTLGCIIKVPPNQLSALSQHVLKAARLIQESLLHFSSSKSQFKPEEQPKSMRSATEQQLPAPVNVDKQTKLPSIRSAHDEH